MILPPAIAADFGFIGSLTTDPANTRFIGDDAARPTGSLADPPVRLMIWQAGSQPLGSGFFARRLHG